MRLNQKRWRVCVLRPTQTGYSSRHTYPGHHAPRNDRAQSKADAIPAGVLNIPFCYAEAAANTLTNPALDPFGKIPVVLRCERSGVNSVWRGRAYQAR